MPALRKTNCSTNYWFTFGCITLIRLSKYLSSKNICSRREAEVFIERGWLLVDGEVVREQGFKVNDNSVITIDERARVYQKSLVTVLLNKPVGYVSGQPEKNYKPATRLITRHRMQTGAGNQETPVQYPVKGLAPAGRLDIDSTGLLVLTQDGRVARQLVSPDSEVEKEYIVRVDRKVTKSQATQLAFGLELDGQQLKMAKVEILDTNTFGIILTEGKKRQIRRMCEQVGLKVTALKRIRIGQVHLGNLPVGQWRCLQKGESF